MKRQKRFSSMVRDPSTYRGYRRNVAREIAAKMLAGTVLSGVGVPPRPSLWRRTISAAIVVFGVVSGAMGFLVLFPRVTVDGVGQVDAEHPNPTFAIGNATLLPITNMRASFAPCALLFAKAPGIFQNCSGYEPTFLMSDKWSARKITMDEKHTIQLDEVIPNMSLMTSADLIIKVAFNPWFIPFERVKAFRFKTRNESDGKLSWIPVAVEK